MRSSTAASMMPLSTIITCREADSPSGSGLRFSSRYRLVSVGSHAAITGRVTF